MSSKFRCKSIATSLRMSALVILREPTFHEDYTLPAAKLSINCLIKNRIGKRPTGWKRSYLIFDRSAIELG
jgi:hypothetical protein